MYILALYYEYFGFIELQYWEYAMGFVFAIIMFIYYSRIKRLNIKLSPEYKYFLVGYWLKLCGGTFFAIIYFYYYSGGDTTSYFYSGVAMKQLLFHDPLEYLRQLVTGDNSLEAINAYAPLNARPYWYVFSDPRTNPIVRLSSVLALVTFNSYLISTLILAALSYLSVWLAYRTFVSYFPQIKGQLAVAFLFMPSALFWGSGIMKDTLTFAATCVWIHAVDEVFFKRRNQVSRSVLMAISAYVMILIKPYIFMVLIPATMLWLLHRRIVGVRNALVRFVLLPFMTVALVGLSAFVLTRLGDLFGKFALDEALDSLTNIQSDMTTNQSYSDNRFDIGEVDGSWGSVLMKFPQAVNATLFRPYLWESKNAVIALSGLENLFVLLLTLYVLLRAGPVFVLRCIGSNPLLLMSMTFGLLFAFVVGVSTPNFGALVRFKIPMMPFYIGGLFIILFLDGERRKARQGGVPFNLANYRLAWSGPRRPAAA